CLLLDEPTAALERDATARLFERVRQLVAGGVAVLYISHHLEEVFEICQDVAVIRDGESVLTAPTATVTKEQLVAATRGTAGSAGSDGGPGGPGETAPSQQAGRAGQAGRTPRPGGGAASRPGDGVAGPSDASSKGGGRPRLAVERLAAASP